MNNSVIYSVLSFIGGAAVGGFVAWKILEPKYKKIADEEIASVKEKFTVPKPEPKKEEDKDEKTVAEKAKNKPNIAEYARHLGENGYIDYTGKDIKTEKYPWQKSDEDEVKSKPRVIEPEEFEENEEYDSTNLTFYADGILAYDDGKNTIVDDVESLVGDALEHIGDFEDDSVHVVNDELEMYYEILVDSRKYEEATKKKPHLDDEED